MVLCTTSARLTQDWSHQPDGGRRWESTLSWTCARLHPVAANSCAMQRLSDLLALQVVHHPQAFFMHGPSPCMSSIFNLRDGWLSTYHVVQLDCAAKTHDVNQ
jgi:hypothetical protein